MMIRQAGIFVRRTKKLNPQAKQALDVAVQTIINETTVGELKAGDLAGVRVYKYKHAHQQYLLAYEYHALSDTLDLLSHGSHENFYRDLKRGM